VSVTGAPTGPILVGTTVRLEASPRDASGAVLRDQTVSWSSSDTTVVHVSAEGTLSAAGVGRATVTTASAGHEVTTSIDVRVGATLARLPGRQSGQPVR
jgi:uncharacterized protein YjdB